MKFKFEKLLCRQFQNKIIRFINARDFPFCVGRKKKICRRIFLAFKSFVAGLLALGNEFGRKPIFGVESGVLRGLLFFDLGCEIVGIGGGKFQNRDNFFIRRFSPRNFFGLKWQFDDFGKIFNVVFCCLSISIGIVVFIYS